MDYSNYNDGELIMALKALIADCQKSKQNYRSIWSYPVPNGEMAAETYDAACADEDMGNRPTVEDYLSERSEFEALRSEVKRRKLARGFTDAERRIVIGAAYLLRLEE